MGRWALPAVAALFAAWPTCLIAQKGEGGGIRPTGLQAVFPEKVRCSGVASPFGSRTRYDGVARPTWSFGGYHGGIDISLPEGTPLLALADGVVVDKGEGGILEGLYLWLKHAPGDSGLPYWIYSKYQHLQAAPVPEVGARVTAGQVVAHSGKTGTVGKHYGPAGYPHLHLTTLRSSSGDVAVGSRGTTQGATLFDPLEIYDNTRPQPGAATGSRPAGRDVSIPYVTVDGQLWPQGTKVVWPVTCQ